VNAKAIANAKATTEADSYGMTNKKATAKTTTTTKQIPTG
jgi:hypothetical protein